MTHDAERVTFTKKKKTVVCPEPLAPLADTHAHLLSFWGKEVPETLVRAKAAGIDLLVTVFDPIADKRSVTDYSDWLTREILPMQDIPQIKYLAGVHPYGAPDYTDDIHAQVVAALDDPLCVGIGEIGLDYHMDYDDDIAPAPHDVQIDCMARQLEVAVRRNAGGAASAPRGYGRGAHLAHRRLQRASRGRCASGRLRAALLWRGPRHDGALCGLGLLYCLWRRGHL